MPFLQEQNYLGGRGLGESAGADTEGNSPQEQVDTGITSLGFPTEGIHTDIKNQSLFETFACPYCWPSKF